MMHRIRNNLGPIWLALSVTLTGCTQESRDSLQGKWALIDQTQKMIVEFRPDGIYRAETDIGILDGHWAALGDDQIATWSDKTRPRRVNRFRFENGDLIILNATGADRRHRRIR